MFPLSGEGSKSLKIAWPGCGLRCRKEQKSVVRTSFFHFFPTVQNNRRKATQSIGLGYNSTGGEFGQYFLWGTTPVPHILTDILFIPNTSCIHMQIFLESNVV